MKNNISGKRLEPTTFVTLFAAQHAIHMRHGGLKHGHIGWVWLVCKWLTGLVLFFVLVTNNNKLNTCSLLRGCEFESRCSHFFIWIFNLGIPYGAKAGLKLRLLVYFMGTLLLLMLELTLPRCQGVLLAVNGWGMDSSFMLGKFLGHMDRSGLNCAQKIQLGFMDTSVLRTP